MTDPEQTALESLFNGSLTGEREQRIYTPQKIVTRLGLFWPEGVALDPCWGPDALVRPEVAAWPENPNGPTDGLAIEWPRRTFVNPPYDNMPPWLAKSIACPGAIMLGPVRTHRKWYRAAAQLSAASVFLDPLTFLGFDATFPAPLSLILWGEVDRAMEFCEIFGDLGSAHRGPFCNVTDKQGELFR